jgi:hypothetical protein
MFRILFLSVCLLLLFWWVRGQSFFHQPTASSSDSAQLAQSLEPSPEASPSPPPSPSPEVSPSPVAVNAINSRSFFGSQSPFRKMISADAKYTKEGRIGSVRPSLEAYSIPIYRVGSKAVPNVKVVNRYSNRTVEWPIPTDAVPSSGVDHHIAIIKGGTIYEMWDATWQGSSSISAGGMKDFSLAGDGISHPANQRVTAAGFSGLAGMIVKEDFLNAEGKFQQNPVISHAINVSLPHALIQKNSFIAPAVGGESHEDNTGSIPLGARYALPKDLDVDALDVHPFVKSLARAVRDYGFYVGDRNDAKQYKGSYVATFKVEPGVFQSVYGVSNDQFYLTVQAQFYQVIEKYGLFRVN